MVNIRLLYGQAVSRELVFITCEDDALHFTMKGHITNANFNTKKMAFILFINNRLVESKPMKSALDSIYAKYLPKGTHPFIYISLHVSPQNVDVNVHPTKQEVRFLHEDQIIEKIQKIVEEKLLEQNKSRTFYTQSLLPGASTPIVTTPSTPNKKGDGTPSKAYRPDQMVRTDSRNQDLTGFLSKTPQKSSSSSNNNDDDADDFAPSQDKNIVIDTRYDDETNDKDMQDDDFENTSSSSKGITTNLTSLNTPKHKGNSIQPSYSSSSSSTTTTTSSSKKVNNNINNNNNVNNNNNAPKKRTSDDIDATAHISKKTRTRKYKTCELTSIQNMVGAFQKNAHEGLLDLFKNHIFVGCVDKAFVLIQYRTKLYLLNMVTLSKELVYQEIFHRFGDFDKIRLSTPLSIYTLILIALDSPLAGWVESNGDKETIAKKLTGDLMERGEMLKEYLAIEIDEDGNLLTLPQILDDYIPQLKYLPLFILWLCTDVEWEYEVECFEGIARQMADFYCIQPETIYTTDPKPPSVYPLPMNEDEDDNNNNNAGGHSTEWVIQHIVFPALRKHFYPPKGFSNDGTIIQIAQLENLYKIFERC